MKKTTAVREQIKWHERMRQNFLYHASNRRPEDKQYWLEKANEHVKHIRKLMPKKMFETVYGKAVLFK